MAPFAEAVERLATIPGVEPADGRGDRGRDRRRTWSQFPTAGHLASWAGMCPGNDESAGKRRSGRTTKGNRWLRHDAGAGGVGGQPHQGDVPGGAATGGWPSGGARSGRWWRWGTRSW